jgi:glycerol-3-phosphate acyltransferase PlsY
MVPVYLMLNVFGFDYYYTSLGAAAIILGHNYPVWLKFKGGRGLAPGAGIFLMLNFYVVVGWGIVWLLVFLFKKKVLISNTVATFCLPLYVLLINLFDFLVRGTAYKGFALSYFTVCSVIITIIILTKHTEVFKELSNKKNI